MANIGPPNSGFPIANLFIVLALFYSFIALYLNVGLAGYISGLAFATLVIMFLYVLIGQVFAKRGIPGQIAFIVLGLLIAYFSGTITASVGLHLALIPLSAINLPQVSLQINGADYTWLLPVALVGFLIYLYKTNQLREIQQLV